MFKTTNNIYTFWSMFLGMLYATLLIVTGVMTNRHVNLFGLSINAGTLVFPLTYAITDVIAEVYGYRLARQVIWASIFLGFIAMLIMYFLNMLPFPAHWRGKADYHFVIQILPLLVFGYMIGVAISTIINSYLISKWKILLHGRYFWLRSIGSSLIGELLELCIIVIFLQVGRVPFQLILEIIISVALVRVIYAIVLSFPLNFVSRLFKSLDKMDVYEEALHFNPFK